MCDAKLNLAHHSTQEKVNANKSELTMNGEMSRVLVLSRFIAFITDNGAKNLKSQREYGVRGLKYKKFFVSIDSENGWKRDNCVSTHIAYIERMSDVIFSPLTPFSPP